MLSLDFQTGSEYELFPNIHPDPTNLIRNSGLKMKYSPTPIKIQYVQEVLTEFT